MSRGVVLMISMKKYISKERCPVTPRRDFPKKGFPRLWQRKKLCKYFA